MLCLSLNVLTHTINVDNYYMSQIFLYLWIMKNIQRVHFSLAQCKRVYTFIAQFAIFRVFQEVNGSWQSTASSSFLTSSSFIYRNARQAIMAFHMWGISYRYI